MLITIFSVILGCIDGGAGVGAGVGAGGGGKLTWLTLFVFVITS